MKILDEVTIQPREAMKNAVEPLLKMSRKVQKLTSVQMTPEEVERQRMIAHRENLFWRRWHRNGWMATRL